MKNHRSPAWIQALLGLATVLCMPLAHADEPVYEMEAAARASYFAIDIYTVKKGTEGAFLTSSLRSGPYDRVATGFGGEKVVEVLPATRDADPQYIILGRYFDGELANVMTRQRQPATDRAASATPTRMQGRLVDVVLSDWAWERNRVKGAGTRPAAATFLTAIPYKDEAKVFQQHIASLNFFKIGYVGQTASVEFFATATPVEEIRKTILARPGMSGTALIALADGSGHVAYTEYYELPATLKSTRIQRTGAATTGVATGVVVENYMAR
ncbi:hypothetical protein [Myxococcus eversor]|uniref:hypothetical protein n=1 Tax=Myxococcus eversor TaxID=2709661 RepID=UPI0013D63E93|nr:hypothetical protein [Myxococcus eversor]